MSLNHGHTHTEVCAPLCPSVGHTFVTLSVWRCDHHGALSGVLTSYTEEPDGLVVTQEKEWVSGPFTADMDLASLLDAVSEYLYRLVGEPTNRQEAYTVDIRRLG